MTFEEFMIQHSIKLYVMHGRDMIVYDLMVDFDGGNIYDAMDEYNVNHNGKSVSTWLEDNGYWDADANAKPTDKFFEMVERYMDEQKIS